LFRIKPFFEKERLASKQSCLSFDRLPELTHPHILQTLWINQREHLKKMLIAETIRKIRCAYQGQADEIATLEHLIKREAGYILLSSMRRSLMMPGCTFNASPISCGIISSS